MMRGPKLAIVVAMALVAAACGGESTAVDEVAPTATAPAEVATPASAAEDPDDTAEDGSSEPSTDPAPVAVAAPPDPFDTLPFVEKPALVAPPAPAATGEEHLAAMFSEVATAVLADGRAVDGLLLRTFNRGAPEAAPDLVLAAISSQASLNIETFGLIEAYAAAGAAAGYGPEFTAFFEVREQAAGQLRELNTSIHDTAAAALTLPAVGKACVAQAVVDNQDRCEDDADAEALIAELFSSAEALGFPDEPDEPYDGFPVAADSADEDGSSAGGFLRPIEGFCAAWEPVIAGLGESALTFDLLVEEGPLNSVFLGRSDCRDPSLEDVGWDPQPATEAYTELVADVVAASVNAPLDEDAYDNDENSVVATKELETITAQLTAAVEAASLSADQVMAPEARLGLLTIAYIGAVELWWRDFVAVTVTDPTDFAAAEQRLFACAGPDLEELATGCSDEQRAVIELRSGLDLELFGGASAEADRVVAWETMQDIVGLCDIWAEALAAIGPEQAERVDWQVRNTNTEEIIGVVDCDPGLN